LDKNHIISLLTVIVLLPSLISAQRKLSAEQQQFTDSILPAIQEVNQEIAQQRSGIYTIYQNFKASNRLSTREKMLITNYAGLYRVSLQDDSSTNTITDQHFKELLKRVDIIPQKLALAQAAIESDWGKSRFVKECNNYFGIHCYTPGCGRAATGVENPRFWVKAFPTIEACIEEYMWLLNTGFAYEGLRKTRTELRDQNDWPDAKELAHGLARYSEKGEEYIKLIDSIIDDYLPPDLNAFVKAAQMPSKEPA